MSLASLNLHTWLTLRNTRGGVGCNNIVEFARMVAATQHRGWKTYILGGGVTIAVWIFGGACPTCSMPKKRAGSSSRFAVNNEVVRS